MKNGNKITERVRGLRRNQTDPEKQLWQFLRNRRLSGYKFTRQHPLFTVYSESKHRLYYIADFYCAEANLVVELDGGIHNERQEYDQIRDSRLAERGIRTIRFRNEDLVLIEDVLLAILEAIKSQLDDNPPSLCL
jgi:very-short-patch-repair endonuclease